MRLPEPKYAIGQTVYRGRIDQRTERLPCPDCRDTKRWEIHTPAGESFETQCARCSASWHSHRDPRAPQQIVYEPNIDRLTIGSVRIDTADRSQPISYMCNETGIGSGSVYPEPSLFETEAEALQDAAIRAAARQEAARADNQVLRQIDILARLTWTNAVAASAEMKLTNMRRRLEAVRYALEDLDLTDDQREVITKALDGES